MMVARRYRSVPFLILRLHVPEPVYCLSYSCISCSGAGGAGQVAPQHTIRSVPLAVCRLVDSQGPARSSVGPLSLKSSISERSAKIAVDLDLLRPARWWMNETQICCAWFASSSWNSAPSVKSTVGLLWLA